MQMQVISNNGKRYTVSPLPDDIDEIARSIVPTPIGIICEDAMEIQWPGLAIRRPDFKGGWYMAPLVLP